MRRHKHTTLVMHQQNTTQRNQQIDTLGDITKIEGLHRKYTQVPTI